MIIQRTLKEILKSVVDYKKAIIVLGPRQVGKTTLIKELAAELDSRFLYINGDEPGVQLQLTGPSLSFLKSFIGNKKVIVIDEAQRITNIGLTVKLMIDNSSGIQILVTGSSSLELANHINEPLTGRKWEYNLFPISWTEICQYETMAKSLQRLSAILIYGMYPEVLLNPGSERNILSNLATSYLYRDLLNFQGIRKPELLNRILQALAWQMGSEVSLNELSRTVEADKNTINNYIDLLSKAFIIFKIAPFSRNLRNEISTNRKIYFYDNGIRNAVIGNYAPLVSRNDTGSLWENFLIAERIKLLRYHGFYGHYYFWRTHRGQEIDYIEEIDGELFAYEFKWSPSAKTKFPTIFIETYKPKETKVIHRDNFWEWLEKYPY